MKRSTLAPLCSALIIPGLGQVINRQPIKGLILMAAVTVILLGIMIKVFLDLSAVMAQIVGPDLTIAGDKWLRLLAGMRARDLTWLCVLVFSGAALWAYSVFDAYLNRYRADT